MEKYIYTNHNYNVNVYQLFEGAFALGIGLTIGVLSGLLLVMSWVCVIAKVVLSLWG